MSEKNRIDVYIYDNGFAASREKAKALIIAGEVYVDGQRCTKPSFLINEGQKVVLKKSDPYVSRGGKKLERALECFDIDLNDVVAIDIGASTGGFTDCMLKNGAQYVYAVDVGYGQLAWGLRQDRRVCVMERLNARYLSRDMFDRNINFASIDVSFISLKLILPALKNVLTSPYTVVALIKPQFEAGKGKVGKKGVVRDKGVHAEVINNVLASARGMGYVVCGATYSPIKGPEGNIEYLACLKDSGDDTILDVACLVEEAHNNIA